MSSLTPTTTLTEDEDDNELRDLVVGTLDKSGLLGQIKAQLRAKVFLALQDEKELQKSSNLQLQNFLKTSDGRLIVHLIREFCSFFGLNFTMSVFDPEVLGGTSANSRFPLRDRDQLVEGLGLSELTNKQLPLLAEILKLSKVSMLKSETPTPTERSEDESSMPSSLDSAGALLQKSNNGDFGSLANSINSPIQSLNASSIKLDNTFILNKSDKSKDGTGSQPLHSSNKSPPSAAIKPFPKDDSPSKQNNLKPSNLASNSPLGNLPPLNIGGSGNAKTLAPLKRVQPIDKEKKDNLVEKKSQKDPKKVEDKKVEIPQKVEAGKASDEIEEEIEEDLEEFLNSSGISTTEDFTKDETISEATSLKADYVEKYQ